MADPNEPPTNRPSWHFSPFPRIQFSMKWLMILVTAVAILLALSVVFGNFFEIVLFSVVFCVLPTPIVICAIFGRRDIQAFAIGALVPWITLLFWVRNSSVIYVLVFMLVLPVLCGSVAVITRRWLSRIN